MGLYIYILHKHTAIYAGLFWLQAGQSNTVAAANNIRGLLFFELMFMSMRAMLGALFTFPSEFKMMLKVCWTSSSMPVLKCGERIHSACTQCLMLCLLQKMLPLGADT